MSRESLNAHFVFSIFFFETFAIYEIILKNIVKWGRQQIKVKLMRIECWILKATNTNSGCVILVALPQQNWLQERASILSYT